MPSNLFANAEDRFKGVTQAAIITTALDSLKELTDNSQGVDDRSKLGIALIGARS